jgi:predicted ArsR family transcriptional regulator
MQATMTAPPAGLDRDVFLRQLLRELAGVLEEVVGLQEAEGFVALVGQRIADWMDSGYRQAYGVEALSAKEVAEVLVDLKRRIQGGFRLVSISDEAIVLSNDRCPFGELVKGRVSLCQMTTSVFGTISAENLGYARVQIEESIAGGFPGCKVRISLLPPAPGTTATGVEFVRGARA